MRWDTEGALAVASVVAVGFFSAACATDPYGSDVYVPPGGPSYTASGHDTHYDEPAYSIGGYSVVPEAPLHSRVTWYLGVHPHPDRYHDGRFCSQSGAHSHDYDPFRNHRYEFHDGYYYWLGDPVSFGLRIRSWTYFGHHPHPHYFGSYCYITGRHHHAYTPRRADSYNYLRGVFHFTGAFGHDYHARRPDYDAHGWRRDLRDHGYNDHHSWKGYRDRDHRAADRVHRHDPEQADRQHREQAEREKREDRRREQAHQRERDERRKQAENRKREERRRELAGQREREERRQQAVQRERDGHRKRQAARREVEARRRQEATQRERNDRARQQAERRETAERVRHPPAKRESNDQRRQQAEKRMRNESHQPNKSHQRNDSHQLEAAQRKREELRQRQQAEQRAQQNRQVRPSPKRGRSVQGDPENPERVEARRHEQHRAKKKGGEDREEEDTATRTGRPRKER